MKSTQRFIRWIASANQPLNNRGLAFMFKISKAIASECRKLLRIDPFFFRFSFK